jgi:hypothetical protein
VKQLGDFTDFTRDSTIKDDKTICKDKDNKSKDNKSKDNKSKDRDDKKEGSR